MAKVKLSGIDSAVDEFVLAVTWDFLCLQGEVKTISVMGGLREINHPSLKAEQKEQLERYIRWRLEQAQTQIGEYKC